MLTIEQFTAIAARVNKATPGPWEFSGAWVRTEMPQADGNLGFICDAGDNEDNALFIAAAREDVPALLAEVADLRRQLAECQAQLAQRDAAQVADAEDYPEIPGRAARLEAYVQRGPPTE